ncbi:MAG: hypothetical protein WCV58_00435 [Patescibacteria group bacterium]|jgi:predicted molibdopterin-dependent oxidoreductase YjgC
MESKKFHQFIKDSQGQKELSLALAKSDEEFIKFHAFLTEGGYIGSDDIYTVLSHLERHKKVYLVINNTSAKVLYDFATQYPTGQVNLLNPKTMENKSFTPDYKNHSLILLTTSEYLKHIVKHDLDFINIVGMVYKS